MTIAGLLWSAAIAHAACPELNAMRDQNTPYRVDVRHTFTTEQGDCTRLNLGPVGAMRLGKVKAVLKTWDDSRTTLGFERVKRIEGSWFLEIPELREGDELRLRLMTVPSSQSNLMKNPSPFGLGPPSRITVDWAAPEKDMVFGAGGNVARIMAREWEGQYRAGVHQVWVPDGASQVGCAVMVDGELLDVELSPYGCAFELPEKVRAKAHLSWTEDGVGPSSEWRLVEGQVLEFSDTEIESRGLPAKEGTSVFVGPGHVSVMLSRLDGRTIEKNAQQEVYEAAKMVSIPEPGLGLAYKGRLGGVEMAGELLELVRDQVQNGGITGAHPLKARPLMKVRQSGWATPWEQALLLTRYLGQVKVPATAYPVRPRAAGFAVNGAPDGYVDAVVRVGVGDEAVWVDPSCRVCAVGEIDPGLWGGQVFAPDLKQLPDGVQGQISSRLVEGKLWVELNGVAALRLRIWLLPVDSSERGALIAELFAGPGSTLVEHEGFSDLGQPIRIVVEP